MFWNFNNPRIADFKNNYVSRKSVTSLYRSRTELSGNDIYNIFTPLVLDEMCKGIACVHTFKTSAFNTTTEVVSWKSHLTHDTLYTNAPEHCNIGVVYTQGNAEATNDVLLSITQENDSGYKQLDLTSALILNPHHFVRVLYCESHNGLIIITNKLCTELVLKIGAILPQVFGYEIDEAFISAFLNLDKDLFETTFLNVYQDYEANAAQREKEKALTECMNILSRGAKNRIANELSDVKDAIQRLERSYVQQLARQKELLIEKASAYWKNDGGVAEEFVQYLKDYCMEDIVKMRTSEYNGIGLEVYYKTRLLYWDEEQYDMYNNSDLDNMITILSQDKRKLCNNIFKDKTVTVNMCTDFFVALETGFTERLTNYTSVAVSEEGCCNPHIYFYNCWGDNSPHIKKAVYDKEYIVAWEQIKATLSGINLSDSIVLKDFINKTLFGRYTHMPILTLNDTGERISVKEFLARYPEGYAPGTEPVGPTVLDVTDTGAIDPPLDYDDEDEED